MAATRGFLGRSAAVFLVAGSLGAGSAAPAAAAPAPAPVLLATAVVIAPAAPAHGKALSQIEVGLAAPDGTSVSVAIVRDHGFDTTFDLDVGTSVGTSGSGTATGLRDVETGDHLLIRLAVSDAAAKGKANSVITVRVNDLRTGDRLYDSGSAALLKGTPAAPPSTGRDTVAAAGTWQQSWRGATVTLDDRPNGQDPNAPYGVAQSDGRFVVRDGSHPGAGLPILVVSLDARVGDRIAVEASTPPTASHTHVTVIDRRSGRQVSSPG